MAERDGEIVEDDYQWDTAVRRYRVFSVMDSELDTLAFAPWWIRRKLIKRIREETKFDEIDHA